MPSRATPDGREDDPASPPAGGLAPGAMTHLLEALAHAPSDAPAAAAPRAGTVVGDRFELVRELGRGSFGVVFEARDRALHRSVAFKLVRPGRIEAGDEQLHREAEVIASLSHPNLVTVFDVGRSQHGPYLVLELLRGRTLQDRLSEGPLPMREALRIAADAARGLAAAHALGVVHRDLKPSNVFLCQDGRVKLLDFGMALTFGRRRVDGGTPAYMAPEQWRRAPEDERTDVYALGVILFQAITGQLPFDVDASGAAVLSPSAAPRIRGAPALADLVGRMLDKDVTARPRDAAAVAAELEAIAAEADGDPAITVHRVRARRRRDLARWALAAVLACGLAVAAVLGVRQLRARVAPPAPRAIAVLPFAIIGGAQEDDWFSDGLAEEILNLLTHVRELKVAASASSFAYKSRQGDLSDVAKRLGVDVVLVGNVRRDKERLRVGAELVDARSGYRLWSEIYDRKLPEVFAIQEDIARRVSSALSVVLAPDAGAERLRPARTNLAAYEAYLRGRAALRLPVTAEHLDQAATAFEEAIARDATFAPAYGGLCETWLGRYDRGRAQESFTRAEASCQEALRRDPSSGDVHTALGQLRLSSGRHAEAEAEFRRARALDGDAVEAQLGLAATYAAERRTADAERALADARRLAPADWRPYREEGNLLFRSARYAEAARSYAAAVERAPDNASILNNVGAAWFMAGDFAAASKAWRASLEIAPNKGAWSNVGSSSYYLGRYAEAAEMYERAIALAPDDHRLWWNLGDAETLAGRRAEAAAAYRKAVALGEARLRVHPGEAETLSALAHFRARLGDAAAARRLRDEALRADDRDVQVRFNAALVSLALGEREAALDHLERAVALGYQRELVAADAALAPLRGDPRFSALVSVHPK